MQNLKLEKERADTQIYLRADKEEKEIKRNEPVFVTYWDYDGPIDSNCQVIVKQFIAFKEYSHLVIAKDLSTHNVMPSGIGFLSNFSVSEDGKLVESIKVETLMGEKWATFKHEDELFSRPNHCEEPKTIHIPRFRIELLSS
jgi:hypothetical protein